MAKGQVYIPDEVKDDIRQRLNSRISKTLLEYESAEEDEDVMTGHLGANLTTSSRPVFVPNGDPGGTWSWSLKYRKFRGRGAGATEKKLGADGIIELSMDSRGNSYSKSMLFQSKMASSKGGPQLVEQCARLTTWREAAAVFSYGKDGFEALTLDAILLNQGDLKSGAGVPLADFLGNNLVECLIGDTDLRYYPDRKILAWLNAQQQRVMTKFSVKHKLKINVKMPPSLDFTLMNRDEISNDEIHKHRMRVAPRDLLDVPSNASPSELKKAQRALSKIYHPDRWHSFSQDVQNAMTARAKEILSIEIPNSNKRGRR